ncbi:PH domain-containing protein [Bacillus infantis]|uniref:PH domain-containing protein n=1 Tax=Bacillus infantis TaxID=324767 RepID=UPI00215515E6|nr:PH domain-containing protein [Bacillus infantis]MCR6609077.1 PH domain-containing protein [Bacillus infantis]
MIEEKRHHPLIMLMNLYQLVKGSIFIVFFLFVIKFGSDAAYVKYGRLVFFLFMLVSAVSIVLKWLTSTYKLDGSSFHLKEGIFTKSNQTIPFSKVQNVNYRTSLFHRIFGLTSIRFETGMTGADSAIEFKVIRKEEAEKLEEHVSRPHEEGISLADPVDTPQAGPEAVSEQTVQSVLPAGRIVHFTPGKKDILKASFTSFSFLVLFSAILSIYFKIDEVFDLDEQAQGLFAALMGSGLLLAGILILLLLVSTGIGVARTYLKYGKYEISSDQERIYIIQGVLDESRFSILKERVQAIEVKQPPIKRLLGLAEVKLTSAGGVSLGEDSPEISTLYPFLPVKRAYELISEILPQYEVTREMKRLPGISFWIRLLKPSWLWILATGGLAWFKPEILDMERAWLFLSAGLLIIIGLLRALDYWNTRYTLNSQFIQMKSGSLSTSLFISKREKVIEVSVTSNLFQKWLGLASIETVNRAKPVLHSSLDDVPKEMAADFYEWYLGRGTEIRYQNY